MRYHLIQINLLYKNLSGIWRPVVGITESQFVHRFNYCWKWIGISMERYPQQLKRPGSPDTWTIDLKFSGFLDGYASTKTAYQWTVMSSIEFWRITEPTWLAVLITEQPRSHFKAGSLFPGKRTFLVSYNFFSRHGSVHLPSHLLSIR